ncbi:MAG: PmbA/TldA family metallopeptidase, partial [Burkholderiaceae bacterium]
MNVVDPMVQRLAVAQSALLEPAGLKQSDLARALGCMAEHRVDDADLYFQYTRSEGWSLEEGQVKSGSFAIEQGVGVRAVSGDKTAFAYSDEIGAGALESAAKATRAIARQGGEGRAALIRRGPARALYPAL